VFGAGAVRGGVGLELHVRTAAARSLCGRAKARDWVYVVDAPAAVEG
jgi:hypothetical protein